MTVTTSDSPPPPPAPAPRPSPKAKLAPAQPWTWPRLWQLLRPWLNHRWLQTSILLGIAWCLISDRILLCREFLFRFTDEDQAIMWYAANEALHGRFHEPCFYGQDYNSCIEGILAAPLVSMGMPFNEAVPLTTVCLGLLPFILLAAITWWRGQTLAAATCLLIPIILPTQYAMITGMPRGFVTGVAFAGIAAMLLLPPGPRRRRATATGEMPILSEKKTPAGLRRSWPALRYFFAAATGLFAVQLNPNCLVLLVPVAIYALLTTWREWKFWVFSIAGCITMGAYLLWVYQFYYIYHDDYRYYLRNATYDWSYANFYAFLWQRVSPTGRPGFIFTDLVPMGITAADAPKFILWSFIAVGILLILRQHVAGAIAALSGATFTLITFGYERVADRLNSNSVSYPYGRMYLAIPVLFVWLLCLVNSKSLPWLANTPMSRWITRAALVGILIAAMHAIDTKETHLNDVIATEIRNATICRPVPVDQVYATAAEVQKIADAQKAKIVMVEGMENKHWAYLLPELTTCETIFPMNDRRTWRIVEENVPRYDRVLLIGLDTGARVGGGTLVENQDLPVLPPPSPAAAGGGRAAGGPGPAGGARGPRGGGPGPAGGGRGPRAGGPGGAGGRGGFLGNPTHTPEIYITSTGGRSLLALARQIGARVPNVVPRPPTKDDPKPEPLVIRSDRFGF